MSEIQNTNDALARLDGALSRIDSVIETVKRKLDQARQDQENLGLERDIALAELDELRSRHAALQAKADHAAERIDALIAVVERALLDAPEEAASQAPVASEPAETLAPAAAPAMASPAAHQPAAHAEPQPAMAYAGGFAPQGQFRPGY